MPPQSVAHNLHVPNLIHQLWAPITEVTASPWGSALRLGRMLLSAHSWCRCLREVLSLLVPPLCPGLPIVQALPSLWLFFRQDLALRCLVGAPQLSQKCLQPSNREAPSAASRALCPPSSTTVSGAVIPGCFQEPGSSMHPLWPWTSHTPSPCLSLLLGRMREEDPRGDLRL